MLLLIAAGTYLTFGPSLLLIYCRSIDLSSSKTHVLSSLFTLRTAIKSNCLFFSSKHFVGCFPSQIICSSPNLASAHTWKYCNNSRLTLSCNCKFGIIPANDHVPLPHMGLQTQCQQLLGTVPIAKPGVSLPDSVPRSFYTRVACLVSAWGMWAIGAGGPTPSCSLFEVSTAPLMVTLQILSEGVTLPILLTYVENKAQRWGPRYWGCVYMCVHLGQGLCVLEHVSNNWVWVQGSNLCLISPGNMICLH